jgi:hypothetical protein
MNEHPYIDFDGDGHGDHYDTATYPDGTHEFIHHDHYGHIDAVAYDYNSDGRIDAMVVDQDHNGTFDHVLTDTNGDGVMDTDSPLGGNSHVPLEHPYIDFDGDGHGDHYRTEAFPSGAQEFVHTDHHGHVDAIAYDYNHDGRIDAMVVDQNHDGTMDHLLADTNGDGIMDTSSAL